jgi:NAD(P)-dependent dehydrogenase (short-subunit alcohol dehydrogenase family)
MVNQRILPLDGRIAVVTGAARGIGLAIAKSLGESGASLVLLGRDSEALEQAISGIPGSSCMVCDVTDEVEVGKVFGEIRSASGGVDILVNNAGAADSAPFLKMDREHAQRMMDINYFGPVFCMQAVLPGMLEKNFGRIVNVASTSALKGYGYVTGYAASKHAVLGMTRCVALETARSGVTVNAVCPGFTETDMVVRSVKTIMEKTGRSEKEARAELAKNNPQGRLIRPDEVAEAVEWLCRPGSGSITGQAITIAGGEVM